MIKYLYLLLQFFGTSYNMSRTGYTRHTNVGLVLLLAYIPDTRRTLLKLVKDTGKCRLTKLHLRS